jgi:serine/threonine protein kinase
MPVAIKVITGLNSESEHRFMTECELQRRVDHRNVIRVYDCFTTATEGYLVMQLCEGETLGTHLASGPLPEREAARVIRSVLLALDDVHSRQMLHRDVKPDNIMYLHMHPGSDVLLGDFGLGKIVVDGLTDSRVGTKGYQAPQILRGHLYDCKCDIWSTGIVAYELLHACLPFRTVQKEAALLAAMEKGEFEIDQGISQLAVDFVRACLRVDPQERPTAAQLIKHPWLAQLEKDEAGK